jgi:hypothetical protein
MAFTYNLSTDAGKVRLIIPDNNSNSYVFEDAEIDAFLALEYSNVRRGAALALETIASNEAYVLKVIELLDLKTDGAKTSDALLKRAKLLRDQADRQDAAEEGGAWDIAEWVVDDFSARERVGNQWLRGVL